MSQLDRTVERGYRVPSEREPGQHATKAEVRIEELEARVAVLEGAARKLCNTPPGDWELTCNGEAFNELDALLPDQSGEDRT